MTISCWLDLSSPSGRKSYFENKLPNYLQYDFWVNIMMNIEIIRSKRRTIAIEVKDDLRVIVRVPMRMKDKEIRRFVDEKSDWIEKHLEIVRSEERRVGKECVSTLRTRMLGEHQ